MSEFISNVPELEAMLAEATIYAVDAAACVYRDGIKASISGPSPSSPGNPPGLRSGRLRDSISNDVEQVGWDALACVGMDMSVGGIGRTPPWLYGIYLENGASAGRPRAFKLPNGQWRMRKNPMLPRPFMKPAYYDQGHAQLALIKASEAFKQVLDK
jgi:hypothetical protein